MYKHNIMRSLKCKGLTIQYFQSYIFYMIKRKNASYYATTLTKDDLSFISENTLRKYNKIVQDMNMYNVKHFKGIGYTYTITDESKKNGHIRFDFNMLGGLLKTLDVNEFSVYSNLMLIRDNARIKASRNNNKFKFKVDKKYFYKNFNTDAKVLRDALVSLKEKKIINFEEKSYTKYISNGFPVRKHFFMFEMLDDIGLLNYLVDRNSFENIAEQCNEHAKKEDEHANSKSTLIESNKKNINIKYTIGKKIIFGQLQEIISSYNTREKLKPDIIDQYDPVCFEIIDKLNGRYSMSIFNQYDLKRKVYKELRTLMK